MCSYVLFILYIILTYIYIFILFLFVSAMNVSVYDCVGLHNLKLTKQCEIIAPTNFIYYYIKTIMLKISYIYSIYPQSIIDDWWVNLGNIIGLILRKVLNIHGTRREKGECHWWAKLLEYWTYWNILVMQGYLFKLSC